MSRSSLLIILGVLTLLTPFSGLPVVLRTLLTIGFGAVILGIGVAERSKEQRQLLAVAPGLSPEPVATAMPEAEPAVTITPVPRKLSRSEPPRGISPI